MSHRYADSRQDSNRSFSKTQKKFVPRNQNQTPGDPNPTPKLSVSLRQSLSDHSGDAAATSSTSGNQTAEAPSRTVTHSGNFLKYLPQDEAVAAGLGAEEGGLDPVESQRVVDLLNRELSRLLKLGPRDFWREVAGNTSLHEFLDTFLQFRNRWYDFPHHGAKGMVAGVIVGEFELSRRIFMVLYRISSNKDPGARAAHSLSAKDHEVILQEKKLLDLPKLLDICAIYGHENEELTRLLVGNALKTQPRIHDNLVTVVSHFLSIAHTMHQRCSASLEVLFSSGSFEDHGSSRLHVDLLEVMDFINDAIVSMDAFVNAYKPAAVCFSCPVETSHSNEDLLSILVQLHDSLLPSLQRGFRIIFNAGEGQIKSDVAISLKMLSTRLVKFGWTLLDLCYLSDEVFEDGLPIPAVTKMFPAKVEDPVIRADVIVQTFRELSKVSLVQEIQISNRDTFLQAIERSYSLLSTLVSLQDTGWLILEDEQYQYLSGIMTSSLTSIPKELPHVPSPVTSSTMHMDEDTAIMESKIIQIKDLFPDYGKGFLAACLDVYNQNPEEVIQRILEGTLHEDLQRLDTTLDTIPKPKSASTINRNDKGKGKVIESTAIPSTKPVSAGGEHQLHSQSVSSSSAVGRYVRKSKNDLRDTNSLDTRDEKDVVRTAALLSQYEYEDEYDDSFDELGLSIVESGFEENETLGDKMSSNMGKSWETESQNSAQSAPSSKWGSRKKPQFYVKDGKNYSYKVADSVAVANSDEASLVTQAQEELIYGLGRGGNLPLGAVKKLIEDQDQQNQAEFPEVEGKTLMKNRRGRGRGGGGRTMESGEQQENQLDSSEVENKGNGGNHRGRGRRGGGRNHYRKDRAMNKHFSGLTGH